MNRETETPDVRFDILRLTPEQLPTVLEELREHAYEGDRAAAEQHLEGHRTGTSDTFLARAGERFAGYITLRWESEHEPFHRAGIPFVQHLEVFPAFQRRGLGAALMEAAERRIATRARQACICVGLFETYGPAQRLYIRRDYLPDGRGICDGHRPLRPGEPVVIAHHLLLWLVKDLTG